MTTTYKTLGQLDPLATTLTDLYTVPAATAAIVEGITIANRSGVATSFRLAVSVGGGAVATKDYVAFDVPIPGNTVVDLNGVITMGAGDKLRAYATLATLSFNAFGAEIS